MRKLSTSHLNLDVTLTRTACLFLLTFSLLMMSAACKRSGVTNSSDGTDATGSSAEVAESPSSTPPFSTKEPERYQARMVIKGSLGDEVASVPGLSSLTNNQVTIARDGDKRRVDYDLLPGMRMSYLQLPTGNFILLPARKVYAEIKQEEINSAMPAPPKGIGSEFSPDKLNNEARLEGADYEKLGAEEVNGRMATKYRVRTTGQTGEAKNVTTETLIWVDESLGMPIKSETTIAGATATGSKYTMELRDIKQDVDPALFELPQGYKKVEYREMFAQMLPSASGLLGGNQNENTKAKKK